MSDTIGTSPSRRRWLIVALTVSAALNLFFIGLLVGMHMHHPWHPGPGFQAQRFERIAHSLNLTDTQQAAFEQFQTVMRVKGAAMRGANGALWAQIAEPTTATDQIGGLMASMVKNRSEFQQEVAGTMSKFLATLTPQQRAIFIHEARKPAHPR